MEISDFAKILLFGSTFEDKLIVPDDGFTDLKPQVQLSIPNFPGRPSNLMLKPMYARESFPSLHNLEKDAWTRGAVIHFFANHELLAIEIMALALLRFPESDPEFRLSLVNTILEEQQHMLLYRERMQEFGIGFGEISVNDFFWQCCKDITNPVQFILALSMTFEQANLDYCKYYQQKFKTIEDTQTVAVLEKVYLDEIGHVKNGLRWISRWKEPQSTLWNFYKTNVPQPLTPARARGQIFDAEGRTAAGIDADFQRELRRFGYSRGKVPDIWCFRPGTEWEVSAQARPKASLDLEHDLGFLPMWFAGPDDLVFLPSQPSDAILDQLLKFRNRLPEYGITNEVQNWTDRKVGTLQAWGWSAKMYKEWHALIRNAPKWQQERLSAQKDAFSFGLHRARSIELENHLEKSMASRYATSFDNIKENLLFAVGQIMNLKEARQLILDEPGQALVAKKVYSSSGNGLHFFDSVEDLTENRFDDSEELLIEKRWQRLVDLSFLYDADASGNYFNKGISSFFTTAGGTYRGHIVGRYDWKWPAEYLRLVHQKIQGQSLVLVLQNQIRELLPVIWPAYRGPVGVDAMIVKDGDHLRLRPVVEINFRYTMGHYSLALRKIIAPNKIARFEIIPKKICLNHCKTETDEGQMQINAHRLQSGTLFLNDPEQARRFVARLNVEK